MPMPNAPVNTNSNVNRSKRMGASLSRFEVIDSRGISWQVCPKPMDSIYARTPIRTQIKYKCVALLGLTFIWRADATTIIAVIYPNAIYLAADSKMSYAGPPPPNSPRVICKIFHGHTKAFACSGVVSDVGINIMQTINLLSANRTLKQWISKSDTVIGAEIPRLLKKFKQDNPAAYAQLLGGVGIDCAFASWEHNKPRLVDDKWIVGMDGELRKEPWNELSSSGQNSIVIGSREAIEKSYGEGAPTIKNGISEMLRALISLQIDYAREFPNPIFGPTVCPPISVLRLDGNGPKWEANGICEH
jgi:hypothetical protein